MVATLLPASLLSAAAAPTRLAPAPTTPTISWAECPPEAASPGPECGTLDLPLDYSDPDGETIEVAISRLASTDPDARRGVLLTNTGGPGGPGLAYPAGLRDVLQLPQDLLDQIRAALGESKVSYFGISYGTYLGAVYTSMFPERSERFLLDSATGPGGWDATFSRKFGEGLQDRFPDFAKYVAARPELGLGRAPAQVKAKCFEIAKKLDKSPRPEGWTGQAFRFTTFSSFYYDTSLPTLAETWQALDSGDPVPVPEAPSGAETLATAPSAGLTTGPTTGLATKRRTASDGAAAVPADNYIASQLHVICNDSDWPEQIWRYQLNVAIDRIRYPMFGAAGANVLIVQNLRDPATPLSGAQELREASGDRARIVTADEGGHLVYLRLGNTCLDDIATEFLQIGRAHV